MTIPRLDLSLPKTLQELLNAAIAEARDRSRPVFLSYNIPMGLLDPIDLFERSRLIADTRLYWSAPGESRTFVGIGAAHRLTGEGPDRFDQVRRQWRELSSGALVSDPPDEKNGVVLVGGFSFDPLRAREGAESAWEGYPDGLLVLPRLLFTVTEEEARLTINLVLQPENEPDAEFGALTRDFHLLFSDGPRTGPRSAGPANLVRRESPPETWKAVVHTLTGEIREGRVEKVVLAREVRLRAPRSFSPAEALRSLQEGFANCYIFAVAQRDRCFLGASPERLVRLEGGNVSTACLAGSTARAADAVEDWKLGQALLTSKKDREEHAVVVRGLDGGLREVCSELHIPGEPVLLKLPNVQHLYTPVTGRVKPGYSILDLVERLHPTPAVGGFPRDEALRRILECEDFDRGWYAGPVGWVNHRGEGEFAVGIRSALLNGDEAALFAGCGIMADSDPEMEYEESALKLKPMLSALQGSVSLGGVSE